jgi:hypothetical protein
MILHHYTDSENAAGIREHGLIPHAVPRAARDYEPAAQARCGANGQPIVWLTANAVDYVVQTVRVSVKLEANSKRLVHYATWARKHIPNFNAVLIDAAMNGGSVAAEAIDDWYIYFGTIPPKRITEILDRTATAKAA